MDKSQDKFYIQSIHRALSLVELVAASGSGGISLTALSEKAELHISTVYRMIQNLIAWQYVSEAGDGHYRLGLALLSLGAQAQDSLTLVNVAQRHLIRLNEESGETIYLSSLDSSRGNIVYIDKIEGKGNLKLGAGIGTRNKIHATANGKVLLSDKDEATVKRLLARGKMVANTPRTITDVERFMQEMREGVANGYMLDLEENENDVACIAAPIRDFGGHVVASVSMSGVVTRITQADRFEEHKRQVMDTARSISEELGWREPTGAQGKA